MRIAFTLLFFALMMSCGSKPNSPVQEQAASDGEASTSTETANTATPQDTLRFPDLEKKNWELLSFELDGVAYDVIRDSKISLQFLGNTLSGNSGCNTFHADVAIGQDGTLKVSPIAQTKMLCQGKMMQEQQFTAVLQAAQTYSVNRIFLEITAANGKMTFTIPQ